MTGKEILRNTLQNKPVPRVPWVPFAGVHAASLTGHTATAYLQSADKMVEALLAVHKHYQPDGLPVVFDLQVEARNAGVSSRLGRQSPHPLLPPIHYPTQKTIPTHMPTPNDGRLPIILEAMNRLSVSHWGTHTALFGLVTGPFTLASHLRGTEIFMDMFDDPNYV